MNPTANPSIPANATPGDVLQSDHHSHFTTQQIAKAVARHKREHPSQTPPPSPQKTTPRH
ncbi:MAG TPA: hypothetical protein VHX37_15210 [Acidobacteriaceae bacterium]|jgi:hypothetical protein|nr:hypothetical protein [Acidobacteriaceae bacterium]